MNIEFIFFENIPIKLYKKNVCLSHYVLKLLAQEPHNINFGLIKYQLIVNKLKFIRYEGTVLATLPLKCQGVCQKMILILKDIKTNLTKFKAR